MRPSSKEKIERKFVEPEQRQGRAGSRKKENSVRAATPEAVRASAKRRFVAAGKETTRGRRSKIPGRAATTTLNTAARTIGKTLDVASDAFASLFAPTLDAAADTRRRARQRKARGRSRGRDRLHPLHRRAGAAAAAGTGPGGCATATARYTRTRTLRAAKLGNLAAMTKVPGNMGRSFVCLEYSGNNSGGLHRH